MAITLPTRRDVLAWGALALAASPRGAYAQQDFPSKPIRMILPFPPGGGADGSTRLVAEHLSKALGQMVIVDNKPGGEGMLAVNELRNSAADGHTILFGSPTALLYVPLTRVKPPFDPLKDLAAVSHFTSFTYFLYANDSVPVTTLAELIGYVRKNPGRVAYGAGDATSHMAMAQIAMQGDLDLLHVPYKGVTQAFQDFAGGRVQLMIGTIDIQEQSRGKAKALAVLLPQRSPLLPEVPTFAEAGLPNLKLRPWTGWFAPAATPRPVLDKLAATMAKVFKDPKLQEMFAARGSLLEASTPEAMRAILVEQMPIWRETIRFAKVPIQD